MKNKKKYIILGIVLLIFFALLIFVPKKEKSVTAVLPLNQNKIEDKVEAVKEITVKEKPIKENTSLVIDSKNLKVSLEVLDKVYRTEIIEGSSVFKAMKGMKDDPKNLFDFKYKENPGLGNFVTEINGMKGTPGKYWIYYVNNEKATIGASQYILKDGDIIRWSQEGL